MRNYELGIKDGENYEVQLRRKIPTKLNFVGMAFLFLIINFLHLIPVYAADEGTNIIRDTPPIYNQWAWNDVIGWIDFFSTDAVNVRSYKIDGYAINGAVGFISLDCATGPAGSNCAIPYNVANDTSGNLSGWGWNENIGWISFSYLTGGGLVPYGVIISPATGEFSDWAWNDVVGWISFNCANTDTCGDVNYKVKTRVGGNSIKGSLESSIFDVGSVDGATLNSIMWRGAQPNGTIVKFQIASSNTPLDIQGAPSYFGPDGTNASFYQSVGPDISRAIKGHANKRFFRYKVFLETDNWQTYSPRIDDVIINYSL